MPSDFITFIILARDSSFIFNTIFVKTTFSSNNGKIQLVLSARHKLDITIALRRAGAVVCAAVWRAALLPQHLPAAGQACHHQLHPAEVRRGPGLLRGVRGTAHQDQQDLQDIQVSQPRNHVTLVNFDIDDAYQYSQNVLGETAYLSWLKASSSASRPPLLIVYIDVD